MKKKFTKYSLHDNYKCYVKDVMLELHFFDDKFNFYYDNEYSESLYYNKTKFIDIDYYTNESLERFLMKECIINYMNIELINTIKHEIYPDIQIYNDVCDFNLLKNKYIFNLLKDKIL